VEIDPRIHYLGAMHDEIMDMGSKLKPPWGSKGAVNRAGGAIRANTLAEEHAVTLEAWRLAHRRVINTFQALLRTRARDENVEVAQRLKRRRTIVDKLSRLPRMDLAQMHDVAGCRLIFPTIEELREFRRKLHRARVKHVLKNAKDKYDYILSPTDKGYRGVHDVYEFRAQHPDAEIYNGLQIEIQYRTHVQHAWATAVEVVTQLSENEPKFGRGDKRHINFFRLASEHLARAHEGQKSCLPELSDTELLAEFDRLEDEIGVLRALRELHAYKKVGEVAKSKQLILQMVKGTGDLTVHEFDTESEASRALLDLEKAHPNDDIVLVGADSVAEVTSAFRNYFTNVEEFLDLIEKARPKLAVTPIPRPSRASSPIGG
jgi:ppGpp synthetase/RelA/SpoT-type nucleotidyltranferase